MKEKHVVKSFLFGIYIVSEFLFNFIENKDNIKNIFVRKKKKNTQSIFRAFSNENS